MVTVTGSYALTTALAEPVSTVTAGVKPPAIVFAPVVTAGSPNAKPRSVRPKDSGSGKTGCGFAPNTRPENQRLVGGTSPVANRLVGNSLTVWWTMPSTRGSTWSRGNTVVTGIWLEPAGVQATAVSNRATIASTDRRL